MDVFATEAEASQHRIDATRADYARRIDAATAEGARIEIRAHRDGAETSWSVAPSDIRLDDHAISFDAPEGAISFALTGPTTPAMLPSLTVMDDRWRMCDAARREIRRIGWDDAGERVLRIWDESSEEHAPATMLMVNHIGMFPPRVPGVEWSRTRTLRADGAVLSARTDERTLRAA
jgi:hypothetical protein